MIEPQSPWGWPWHGLITGGVIGDTGKSVTQPLHGYAWLIDMGLAAITRGSAEQAHDTANHFEWRNYALIPAGRIHDTALPENSFIHVDEANIPWLVELAFSFPSGNTLRVDYTIVRFGLFGTGVHTPVTGYQTVSCEDIALGTNADTLDEYTSRIPTLWDVNTNGKKCLIGVDLVAPHLGVNYCHMCALVEATLSGTGGDDGSDLSFALAEIQGHAELRNRTSTGDIVNGESTTTWSRFAYYNADDVACSARMQIYYWAESTGSGSTEITIQDMDLRLQENGTTQDYLRCYRVYDGSLGYATSTWTGSISSHLTSDDAWNPADGSAYRIINAFTAFNKWMAMGVGDTNLHTDIIGYQRIDAHSHALFYNGASRNYQSIVTPAGVIAGPASASANVYVAWQRKTGDTTVSTSPVCYV